MAYNDSLPYIDVSEEKYNDIGTRMVEEEMKRMRPRKVEPLSEMKFRSPLMEGEIKRLAADRDSGFMKKKDPPLKAPTENKIELWEEAVRQAKIAYEKERIRNMLLDISKEGSTATEQWKTMNAHLESLQADVEKSLQDQQAQVNAINLQRETDQRAKGQELHVLSTHYANLIEKTYQLKRAVAELKEELKVGSGP
eukprot:scaffold1965_cov145-Amphora_coffeaeformis.AAC.1